MTKKQTPLHEEIKQSKPFDNLAQEATLSLLRSASLLRHYLENSIAESSLSLQQFNVLRILIGAQGPLPIMEVAARMVEPTPAITRLISKLEKRDFLKKTQSQKDLRIFEIEVTTQGIQMAKKLSLKLKQAGESSMGLVSEKKLAPLLKTLDLIRHSIPG